MGFQQGFALVVLAVALCVAGGAQARQLLPGFSAPAPYAAPKDEDFRLRTVPLEKPIVLTPPQRVPMLIAPGTSPVPDTEESAPRPIMLTAPDEVRVAPVMPESPPPLLTIPTEDTPERNPIITTSGGAVPATVPAPKGYDKNAPVDLTADSLQHDDASGVVTATGSVELVQAGRTLRADSVSYNLNSGVVTARGHVVLSEPTGDVHFAEEVELGDEMASGFVVGLRSFLENGGQFTAVRGERVNSKLLTLHEASYTPCQCDLDKNGKPAWQIRAREVKYDEDANKITYRNARFELFGTPVLWTPYLAHSDGKIKRQSGLLPPGAGYKTALGAIWTQNYYWAIAPDRDMTIGTMLTTRESPVALAEYRQRWGNGRLQMSGSATHSGRTDDIGGQGVSAGGEWRGHLFVDGRWDINEKWRTGVDVEVASDDQYLRQYDFLNKDVLENRIYAERFSGRNYANVQAMAFQDVRVLNEQTDQPHVLPEAMVSFMGEPNATLGGRWALTASALGLVRDGSGQDMARGVVEGAWQRRDVMDSGLVTTVDLNLRGDAYAVNDRALAAGNTGRSREDTAARIFPQAHIMAALPLAKPLDRAQILVEPVAALTVGANINNNDGAIPNEDSEDVQIDATNLFNPNRFPGYDRIEDRARATYGVRTGVYGDGGSHVSTFIGQSYNLRDGDNPFPRGSGLSRRQSDVVGSVSALYDGRFGVNYRFQIDDDGWTSQRHEFDGYAHWKRLSLGSRYLFAKGLGGTIIDDSREQVEGNVAYFLTDSWRARLGGLYDLGMDDGLRGAVAGFDYYGCCVSFSATAERRLTADSSGDGGTSVMLRLGLKGLGGYQTAAQNYWGGLSPSSMPRQ